MDVARLVLEYLKALVWPVALVVALVVFRRVLPDLLSRLRSVEALGAKAEFAERLADVSGQLEDAAATSPPKGADDGQDGVVPPEDLFSPRRSSTKNLRGLRFNLQAIVEQGERAFGLEPLPEPTGTVGTIKATGQKLRFDVSLSVLEKALRRLAPVTGLDGWNSLADALLSLHAFAEQPLDRELKPSAVALLAQNTLTTARQLATRSLEKAPTKS
jgi:hypothetical protein